jgi:hypothetical protein
MRLHSDRLESLASPAFIAALALLVVNDVALKPLFHNVLTGKLSDFAGLFALTLFATTLWPRYRRLAACAIATAFAFWKTTYAEPLIALLNAVSPVAFGRTVDLTDLVALPMIPLAVWAAPRIRSWPLPRALQIGLAVLAPIAFTATSRASFVVRSTLGVGSEAAVDDAAVQSFFDDVADKHGLRCRPPCEPITEGRVYFQGRGAGPGTLVASFDSQQRTVFYVARGHDRDGRRGVLTLSTDIRAGISDLIPGITTLEYEDDRDDLPIGEGTTFVISVPGDGSLPVESAEHAKRTLSTIVEDVVRAHGLSTDEHSLVYYAGKRVGVSPEARDLALFPTAESNSKLRVGVVRYTVGFAALERAVTEDLAARLDRAFGRNNVTREVLRMQ